MEVKLGYKQTTLGLLPDAWEAVLLGDLFVFKNGLNKAKRFFGTGTPIVNYMDVFERPWLKTEDLSGRVHVSPEEIKNFEAQMGDVFFTRTSETVEDVGIASVMLNEPCDTVFSGFVLRARPRDGRLDNHYKKYCFAPRQVRAQIVSNATYTTRALTNGRSLSAVWIAVPPNPEQRAIAEALSDADALIESLEQLLTKKRQLKKGAMQDLLIGKKRLPGFSEEWQTRQLGEVINHCSSGATPYRGRPDYYTGTVKWITSGELNYNVITDTIEHISEEAVQKTNLKIHPAGTFLMAITGLEAAGTRGACGIVGSPATTNQSCMAIYPSIKLKTAFLYHYYVMRGNELALQYCQGTKQQSYTAKLVRLLPIDLPPTIQEQAAIATILSDMDAEIAALEAKLSKARQIKQGMMQELLTGRIRLI